MKLITIGVFSLTSIALISISYYKRTEAYSGISLKNTEELLNSSDDGALLRFCRWKGHTNVAYAKIENRELKTIICANP